MSRAGVLSITVSGFSLHVTVTNQTALRIAPPTWSGSLEVGYKYSSGSFNVLTCPEIATRELTPVNKNLCLITFLSFWLAGQPVFCTDGALSGAQFRGSRMRAPECRPETMHKVRNRKRLLVVYISRVYIISKLLGTVRAGRTRSV